MAVPVGGKVILDTNVFVDYLRQGSHAESVFGRVGEVVRFLSSIVLMELRLGANTPRRARAVDRIRDAFPSGRLVAPVPQQFDQAGRLFRILYGNGSGLADRLGPINGEKGTGHLLGPHCLISQGSVLDSSGPGV